MGIRSSVVLFALAVSLPAQADEILALEKGKDRRARDLLYNKLHSIRVDVHFERASAADLAEYLTVASGNATNFVVHTKEDLEPVTLRLKRTRLTTVMGIAQRFGVFRFAFRDGIVRIQHDSEVREFTSLRRYDVRWATTPIPSFPGPELRLKAPGDEEPIVDQDVEDSAPASGFTPDRLVDLIRTQVLPDSWDADGVSVSEYRGVLWVRQTDRGHRVVEELLRALGVIAPSPPQKSRAPSGSSSSTTR